MFQTMTYTGTVAEQYNQLNQQLDALLEGETNTIAQYSNAAALLNQFLTNVNWVGFYLMENSELVLGPFQGLPACVRIPSGKGVCGKAAETSAVQRIDNVHDFPGHIACDAASNSEIVLPIIKDGELIGVLDIDSPEFSRFTAADENGLRQFVSVLIKHI
ncbi:GAF domain-containing protein [Salisediminibacterium halotolerans]|uniref:GAF domain-containing protein n=1 Tax=Salisediminibacterium halotolerans TaxID=517425 RepID=UPI000EADE0FD|nr:GAF domain-containing protein [Salisediminibacterium halotolerans]RLJ69378.1 GAF domain-containing protein [Actinophytocola xinjiangensis]RPE83996.1 GAF domain-containing protein [Salisediminibacterium halotolerans]TWG32453.1 GAF domain-containing protein [Salisediminibacterium halotolerans]GEL07329.1 hypothetical protein SHA02_07450 [Salisediminibacterium halotolerans]